MTNRNDIEQLFKAHYAQMYRVAAALVHDDDVARDMVHDVFAKLLEKGHDTPANAGYLLTAIRNRCLNHLRNCEIHQRIAACYFLDNEEYETEGWPDEETLSLIHNLICNDVSRQARRVLELRFSSGLPFADVAKEMGISESAVYRHLSNALAIIRKKLNENG